MATGNPLDDDVTGSQTHGPPDTPSNPLTSDVVAGGTPPPRKNGAPPSIDSWWNIAGHRLGMGTRDVIEGLTSLPTAALDVATWPARAIQRAAGIPTDAPSTLVQKGLDVAGLPTPQTTGEQATSAAIRGGAAMLPMMVAPGLPSMLRVPVGTTAARATVPLISGSVGAETGKQLSSLPEVPETFKPTVDLLGNILGGGLANVGVGAFDRAFNLAAGTTSRIAQAFDTLNIKPPTIGSVSGGPVSRSTEAAFGGVAPGQMVLQPKAQQTVADFGRAVDDTASQLHFSATGKAGVVPNASQAGATVQDAIRDWRYNADNPDSFVAIQDRLYQPVNAKMFGQPVAPDGYRAALQDAAKDPALDLLPDVQQQFVRQKFQDMLDALDKNAQPGKMLTWEQGQAIRKQIGDMLGTPRFVQDLGERSLSRVYGGIARDLEAAADGAGVGDQFRAANAYSTEGHNFINRVANKAVTTNNPSLDIPGSKAAENLLNLPDEAIQALRLHVPKAADALAAYNLRDMANAKPNVATSPNETSIGTFQTNLNRLKTTSPGTYEALYNADPSVAQKVGAMGTVGDQMRRIAEQANASRTAYGNYLLQLAMGGATGALAHGPEGAAGVLAAQLGVPYAGARILTNPMLIRLLSAQPGPRNVSGLLGGTLSYLPEQQRSQP